MPSGIGTGVRGSHAPALSRGELARWGHQACVGTWNGIPSMAGWKQKAISLTH